MAMLVITRGYVCQVLRRTDGLTLEKCCDRPSAARRLRSHEELQIGWGDPVPYFALKPQVTSTQSAETQRFWCLCCVDSRSAVRRHKSGGRSLLQSSIGPCHAAARSSMGISQAP